MYYFAYMEWADFRLFFKQHDTAIGAGIIAILIFLLGWHMGRIMSPYYASTPIVFEDRTCNACPASSGSLQELQNDSAGNLIPTSTSDVRINDSGGLPAGLYVASKNSDLFHHYTCPSAHTIKEENQLWFATYEEAAASGRQPSSCTQKLPR